MSWFYNEVGALSVLLALNMISAIAILFMVAIGLAIIFGLMGVVNLAQGEFIMIGAFAAVITVQIGLSPWFSFILAPLIAGFVGLITERVLMRHLYGKIMESILATWGLGIVLRQVMEMIFGKGYKSVPMVVEQSTSVLGTEYPIYRLLIVGVAIALLFVLFYLERKTDLGVTVRAVMQNPELSSSLGVNVNKVYRLSFIAGSALAGFAGALIAPLVTVFPSMGMNYVINAFLVVLAGGMGSLFGVVGSASLLGGSGEIVSYLFDPVWGSISIVIITVIIMRFRRATI